MGGDHNKYQKPVKSYCRGEPNYCTEPEEWVKQEPVAWIGEAISGYREFDWTKGDLQRDYPFVYPLYTAPPKREWVGLTDDDVLGLTTEMANFARHIDAKLRERNHD
jgi:hypothetical protein